MIIRQLLVGGWDVFCYIIACPESKEAIVLDPSAEVKRIYSTATKDNLAIKYIFNTHRHQDHTAGNRPLQKLTGASLAMHILDSDDYPDADILFEKETHFSLGTLTIDILHTPGHTPGGICLYSQGQLFTGDTLFVGDSGRTDLPGGDRATLGASIRRLMQLPDDTVIWPGHDYGPTQRSTIGWEKKHNVNAREYAFFDPS